ncbi:cation/H+ exchanger protein 1 [Elysia marginata]|uniref:Cation/H+ exchanger protein 1 n=1 Tax=Elysia marginata TaxID=1093978 RepID=A0AAV4GS21_9GAST|nr:cation/H+ exchanger protein 1 [Elysia marginata]
MIIHFRLLTKRGRFEALSLWFRTAIRQRPLATEKQLLVQGSPHLCSDQENNSGCSAMSKYGSDEHSQTNFGFSNQEENVTSKERAAKSQELTDTNSDNVRAVRLDDVSRHFSINSDVDSPRSHSQSDYSNVYRRKMSDPQGTRGVDLRRRISIDRSDELLVDKGRSRHNSQSNPSRRNQQQLHISARHRRSSADGTEGTFYLLEAPDDHDFYIVEKAENEVEARRMINNYMFGFKIWRSRVSSQSAGKDLDLYSSQETDLTASTERALRPSTILYTVLIGWWLALLYYIIGCLMYITVLARDHGKLCFALAKYFFYPFGKNVHTHTAYYKAHLSSRVFGMKTISATSETLTDNMDSTELDKPPASLAEVTVVDQSSTSTAANTSPTDPETPRSHVEATAAANGETTTETKQGRPTRNFKHWKTPGMYVWVLLGVPVLLLAHAVTFFFTWFFVVTIPIAKINGHAITKVLFAAPTDTQVGISGKSNTSTFAVGAIMNATFGSIVEVILYVIMLIEGASHEETCYMELVKSTMTGSILSCILLTPGISMIVGGLKYRRQHFNHLSTNISSSLLFVAVIGVFAPTIFSKMNGNLSCDVCQTWENPNSTFINETGFICSGCKTVTYAPYNDDTLFKSHVMPLMYSCAVLLPLSYIVGLIFSMKTHSKEIFEEFEQLQKAEGAGGHGSAQWSNTKSAIILLLSVTAISLCSELIADNIAPLLNAGIMTEYFVGVSLLSIVGVLPELVNGVLFALQNNVNLGIEIGSAAAIQVGMVQLPIIVLADLIYPLGFGAVFNDIHLYAVIFAVIIINYVFMDGKSDYFQGSIVVFIYLLLMAMYFFTVTPQTAVCKH